MVSDEIAKINSASAVVLSGRIDIFPSMPLPELNSPGGLAYAARFKSDAGSSLYAIVCASRMPLRIDSVQSFRSLDNPGILRLVEGGVAQWADGSQVYVLVYQKPTAPRLFATLDDTHPILSEDSANRHFIGPMIGALTALANSGVVHNAIRPTNIFWRSGTAIPPQIGECLSVPAGVGQPAMFEPLERAMSMPIGRGVGSHADDCYAFGVSLAFLLMGCNPMQGLNDQEIIDLKIQRGSFAAIIGNRRLSPTHIEILRGLLADDALQRWTAADLDQWLSGRRMTPKSSDAGRRAARHFIFQEKEYWQIGPLAAALANNTAEAVKIIENESLNKWLLRALDDKDRAENVNEVISDLKQNGKTARYEDQLVSRVCIVLDHAAPIRYRGISTMPSGIPALLVEADQNGDSARIQILSEIILSQLVSLWIQMQGENKADYISMGQLFDRVKTAIEKTSYGNGIERAIYEMNPGLPCLSPFLKGHYVLSGKTLLTALERVATGGNKGREPIDRHIAAFLAVRERHSERMFIPFSTDDSLSRGLALLSIYSEMQRKYGPEDLPQLAVWLSPVIEPALRRYFSKTLRESLHKRAVDLVKEGKLGALLQLIDDPRGLDRDQKDFHAARLLYLNIQKEILALEAKVRHRDADPSVFGRTMVVTISCFLAVILVCAAVLREMYGAFFG